MVFFDEKLNDTLPVRLWSFGRVDASLANCVGFEEYAQLYEGVDGK